ncbi:shikimate kinase [Candidatus Uhrbacteria bacterium]|nr:shikimate kinase [Candidatus Uhrbacteria bacterium]
MDHKIGITLIGMPGSGKSTVGKLLAARLDWKFVDLDALILEKEGIGHEQILAEHGAQKLLELENRYTLKLDMKHVIFSPGGSIVYCAPAMEKLKMETLVVYLDVPLAEVRARIGENPKNIRGIVGFEEKGLAGLFAERVPLFREYAHYTIQSLGRDPQDVAGEIKKHLSN